VDSLEYLEDRELAEERDRLETHLLRGDASDWADYKYLCGQIRGIQFAMQVLAEARQKVAEVDE